MSPKCRFGMPRFPMWRTMLTKPIKGASSEEKELRRHFNNKVLDDVRDVLENNDMMKVVWKEFKDKKSESKEEYIRNRKRRILEVLRLADVRPKDYVNAVRESSKKGLNIILARDVDEIFINNYNPEWILAWNANIDIQLCFDFFAVITYITEYFTKDESHTSVFLNQAAKKCLELGQIKQKKLLKNSFLIHREMRISEAFMKLLPEMKFKD